MTSKKASHCLSTDGERQRRGESAFLFGDRDGKNGEAGENQTGEDLKSVKIESDGTRTPKSPCVFQNPQVSSAGVGCNPQAPGQEKRVNRTAPNSTDKPLEVGKDCWPVPGHIRAILIQFIAGTSGLPGLPSPSSDVVEMVWHHREW